MKARKQENHRTLVQWIDGDMMYFRYYKRDTAALNFAEWLLTHGIHRRNINIKMI